MGTKELNKQSRILVALAAGHSCEEILATDRTLSYHDIFHAIAEAPTSYWRKQSAETPGKAGLGEPHSSQRPARCPVD
jgi:hypothetical protein